MRIQHNIVAMNAYRNFTVNNSALAKNLEKLSAGYKINRAGDDAAGLAISEKMRAQITGLETAQKNAKDGISLVQTAEGALTEVHDMLNRMVQLASQSANGTYSDDLDRVQLQKEVESLKTEINRIAESANFNGINLLDGSLGLSGAFDIKPQDAQAGSVDKSADIAFAPVGTNKTSDTILKAAGGSSVVGGFTLDLSDFQAAETASTGSMEINLTINGATVATLTFGSSTRGNFAAAGVLSAAELASTMKSLYFVVSNNGSYAFATGTAAAITAAGTGGLIYAGTAVSGNTLQVQFKLDSVATAGGSIATATQTSDLDTLAAVVSTKALKSLEFQFNIAGKTNAAVSGAENRSSLNVTNTNVKSNDVRANATFSLPMSKIADGDVLKIGVNSYQIKLDASASNSAYTKGKIIDLSDYAGKLDTTSTSVQKEIMSVISKAVTDNDLFSVGVTEKYGHLGIAEKPTNSYKASHAALLATDTARGLMSAVSTNALKDIAKALAVYASGTDRTGTIQSMVTLTDNSADVKDGMKVTLTTDKLVSGDALTIDDVRYQFVKGTIPASLTDSDTVKYISYSSSATKGTILAAVASKYNTVTSGTRAYVDDNGVLRINNASNGNAATVLGKGLTLQIGDTSQEFNKLYVAVKKMDSDSMGVGGIDISTQAGAAAAVDKIKAAINYVSDVRGTLGATQNRLDHTINNLSVMVENITDAESTIRDTDMAEEMMAYTKNSILNQAAQAMLAQANQLPQGVLQLLQ